MNPYFIVAFLVALIGSFGSGFYLGDESGSAQVKAAWAKADIITLQGHAARVAAAGEATKSLQENLDEQRRLEKRAQALRERDMLADLASLRERPNRKRPGAADLPQPPGDRSADSAPGGGWASGDRLLRDDAEFLVRYAQLATIAKSERDSCRASYEKARQELIRFNRRAPPATASPGSAP